MDQPFWIGNAESGDHLIKLDINLTQIHSSRFTLYSDDCLAEIKINNQIFEGLNQDCHYSYSGDLDFSKLLKPGINHIEFKVYNNGGGIGLYIVRSHFDFYFLTSLIVFLLALCFYIYSILRRTKLFSERTYLIYVLIAGILARFIYCLNTYHKVRAHDVGAHIEYIDYMIKHFAVPPYHAGFEFYQPPLYYFLSAIWMKFGSFLGLSRIYLLDGLQFGGFALSVISLLLFISCLPLIINKPQHWIWSFLCGLIAALFPGLILASARISNDSLVHFLCFTAVVLLIHWWKSDNNRYWYLLSIVLGLGIITKLNILLLFPSVFLCLLLKNNISFKEKARLGLIAGAIILLIGGWYLNLRYQEGQKVLVGNIDAGYIDDQTRVPNKLSNFLTFNPSEVIDPSF